MRKLSIWGIKIIGSRPLGPLVICHDKIDPKKKDKNNAPKSNLLNYNVSFAPEMDLIQYTIYQ